MGDERWVGGEVNFTTSDLARLGAERREREGTGEMAGMIKERITLEKDVTGWGIIFPATCRFCGETEVWADHCRDRGPNQAPPSACECGLEGVAVSSPIDPLPSCPVHGPLTR